MKLSKNKEKELMQVYEAYWAEYLNGNVDAMQALLDDSYTQIGSAAGEVFASKKEAVQFLVDTIDQVAGKLEMRNRNTKLELQDHLILIHEVCDLYALADKKWIFYSKFRASTLLQEKKEGWKITHQHSSFPDTKTEEGQNVAIDKIAEENKELREAVKRRTVELEHKNRELQIEAALERVRARTMAMHKSDELKEVIQVVYDQFILLNINIEHSGFIIDYRQNDFMHIWLTDRREVPSEVTIPYFDTAHWNSFNEAKEEGLDFFTNKLDFEEKNRFYKELFKLIPRVPDETIDHYLKVPGLAISTVLLDDVGLYIENFDGIPYTDYENKILLRIAKVFQQTYTRFLDLQKAETQAREAQIETALERVRSRSMAMHKSEELADLSLELVKQVQALGVATWFCAFNIYDEDQSGSLEWGSNGEGTFPKYRTPREGVFLRYYKAGQKGETLLINEIGENECASHYDYLCSLPGVGEQLLKMKDSGISFPTSQIDHVAFFKHGYILFITYEPVPDAHDIFKRFAKVFQQTYTRFLDLQKAEAQAREAQIEIALERVRSKTMAMHNSDDVAGTVITLFDEVIKLGLDQSIRCGIGILEGTDQMETWSVTFTTTGKVDLKMGMLNMASHPVLKAIKKAWTSGETSYPYEFKGKDVTTYYTALNNEPNYPFYVELNTLPDKMFTISFFFSEGLLFAHTENPISEEAVDILKRFTAVFGQTYRRYLDLLKAEAQAREAQIEAAMERIRSRAIAMRSSNELLEVALEIRIQTDLLGQQDLELSVVHLYEKDAEYFESLAAMRTPGSEGEITTHKMKFPVDATPEIQEMMKNYWAGLSQYTIELNLKQREAWQKVLETTVPDLFDQRLQFDEDEIAAEKKEYWNFTDFSGGSLLTVTYSPPTTETKELFRRAADVFDLAYRRYVDLKKAEAQAREAQIEAALERVRSKTMAMHNSADVGATVVSLSDEVLKLGLDTSIRVGIGILEGYEGMETWSANPTPNGKVDLKMGMLDMTIHPMLIGLKKAWKNGKSCYSYDYIGDDVFRYYQALNNEPEYPFQADLDALPENEYHKSFFYTEGILFSFAPNPISEAAAEVLARFAKVFGQTYRRYLDLQKAEAQAREAEIEATLEKVRSRTMAMHKSEELAETALVLYEQFSVLGNIPDRMSIGIFKEETKEIELWPTDQFGSQLNQRFKGFWKQSAVWTNLYKAWKSGNDSLVVDLSGQKLKTWLKFIREEIKLFVDDTHIEGRRVQQAAFFSQGFLLFTTNEPVTDEIMQLLVRFAKVFSQTYTRFLDLQKAEAQAKEAQIENALEKVRSRTMAMQNSYELPEAANDLFLQVQALGIPAWSAGYCIWETKDKKTASCNMSSEGEIQKSFILPTIGEGYNFYDPLQKGETFYVEELGGDALVKHYDFMRTLPTVGKILDELIAAGLSLPTFQIFHIVYFPQGYLMFITYEQVPDAHEIFKRFAKVFEQTYTRFLDLQKAEAQAREATKQASLDRVRGQIASMRKAADLERITPLLWNELTTMEVPFIRCGVFIMHEPKEIVEVYLSAPDGHSLGVLHLQFNADPLTANTVAHWRKETIFKEHWNREEFLSWTQSLIEQGQISNIKTYQGAANPPESLNLHFIPFTQGMLYVGSENPLNVEQIELVQSLADTFAIAYARYEDFTKLEKAKESVETTLTELKTTQTQLVQSEKMASLGELTAGIAHEIQNPLNFVNNFSEVSSELLEEMNEEIEKGDLEEARAIATDVKQNLEKILHHGKRADGIVKGMLQHSRTSSGEKEPTDINVLADEYLRLAYHGLRAKDKSFNATMKTAYDDSLQKVNVIPQDIGRVILNLITNAFYACTERSRSAVHEKSSSAKASGDTKYEPTVTVSTKKTKEGVEIRVKDNGNGIPEGIKEKIFQPFFTTKPTGQGTGLGLSLSYDIVKAHGGELKVETKEGKGTEIKMKLPI